jgi:hypothetical protein
MKNLFGLALAAGMIGANQTDPPRLLARVLAAVRPVMEYTIGKRFDRSIFVEIKAASANATADSSDVDHIFGSKARVVGNAESLITCRDYDENAPQGAWNGCKFEDDGLIVRIATMRSTDSTVVVTVGAEYTTYVGHNLWFPGASMYDIIFPRRGDELGTPSVRFRGFFD